MLISISTFPAARLYYLCNNDINHKDGRNNINNMWVDLIQQYEDCFLLAPQLNLR